MTTFEEKIKMLLTSICSFIAECLLPLMSFTVNSLQNNEILNGLKLKAFADNKINAAE